MRQTDPMSVLDSGLDSDSNYGWVTGIVRDHFRICLTIAAYPSLTVRLRRTTSSFRPDTNYPLRLPAHSRVATGPQAQLHT
jgi:hypothetical protein